MNKPSDKLIEQRVRNRLIESFDVFADEAAVDVLGTDGIIEIWYDYVDNDWIQLSNQPVYTEEELASIHRFHELLESVYKKLPSTFNISDLVSCKEWAELSALAQESHDIFMKNGLSDEEKESHKQVWI